MLDVPSLFLLKDIIEFYSVIWWEGNKEKEFFELSPKIRYLLQHPNRFGTGDRSTTMTNIERQLSK